MRSTMQHHRRSAGLLSALAVAAALLAAAGPAAAGPVPGGADAAGAGTVTMVNGAGTRITIPVTAATALRSASSAGSSGTTSAERAGGFKAGRPGPATVPPPGVTQQVIGTDDRIQESVPGTYPWEAIVYLTTNQGQCTGFMLSRDVVVTAGHCVYEGGWVTSYTAVPGKVGSSNPYGSCSGGIADVWTNSTWISSGSADADYGLIKLTCDIGNTVGWFGWWYNEGETLTGTYLYVEGYPADKPYATMWWDSDPVSSQSATRLFYSIDTAGGQSGSPIYHYNSTTAGLCSGWCVTGIHKGATGSQNHGTRFNSTVMSFINYWINQP